MPKKPKQKTRRKSLFNRGLVKLAAASVIVGCGVLIFTTEKDCSEKERELASVQNEIDLYEAENTELQRVLDSDDITAYMEKIAVEERDYAYPDELRFYDKSRD